MIKPQILRKLASGWNLRVDVVEKHYILGWILFGISKSSIGKNLVFKGGTSLSKVYFPSEWRLSEDLDYTLLEDIPWDTIIKAISEEVPKIVAQESGISISLRSGTHTNPEYLQGKMKYAGPIGPGTVKIEITKESFIGKTVTKAVPNVPADFDYKEFSVKVYSIETIVGEKTRAILQRGYIRDYYDVWKLFKGEKFDQIEARTIFESKCKAKNVTFTSVDDFFPPGTADILKEHLHNLVRLIREPLPPVEDILNELKESLKKFLK